jgi:hypothetical protein
MDIQQFIEMMRAVEEERPFEVGFQLRHSEEGGLTIQQLGSRCGYGALADFLAKVAGAEPPRYLEEAR